MTTISCNGLNSAVSTSPREIFSTAAFATATVGASGTLRTSAWAFWALEQDVHVTAPIKPPMRSTTPAKEYVRVDFISSPPKLGGGVDRMPQTVNGAGLNTIYQMVGIFERMER